MRIAAHLTEKLMYRWPVSYWVELIHKLTKQGHHVYAVSDEYTVAIKDDNPLLHNCLHLPDEQTEKVIAGCDLYIGVPGKYYDMAKRNGVRVVGLLGATKKGEGVVSSSQCAGCTDLMPNRIDCLWADELCMFEITPNDVLRQVAA